METSEPKSVPYDLEALVVAAFRTAQSRGKPDWRRMTVAVLKNRLLQMTRRAFSVEAHGARTFRELVARLPHLVALDGDEVVFTVGDDAVTVPGTSSASKEGRYVRLRPDLWRAIVDYASGKRYAWDPDGMVARPSEEGDDLVLPTLTEEEMRSWREEFAAPYLDSQEVRRWLEESRGTKALPEVLQGPWNGLVRDRVAARLEAWFSEHGLQVPPPQASASTDGTADDAVERLRRLVISCVEVMTAEELADMRLPPAAVLRTGVFVGRG